MPDINGDEKQFYKAISSIFNNAIKFTDDCIKYIDKELYISTSDEKNELLL